MRLLLFAFLRFYQLCLRPFLPAACRFAPSCSHYAQEAVSQHGALKGGLLALTRILRCHPFGKSGFDPVPPSRHEDIHAA